MAVAQNNPDAESEVKKPDHDPAEIVNILAHYKEEAENARQSGPNPRDQVWRDNWDRYWGRYDFSKKAAWQAKFVMPEVPQFVDRWAAAMREALTQAGQWWSVIDPADTESDLIPHVEKFMRMLLSRAGRTADGHIADFTVVFEDQMKLGALMACCAAVTWQEGQDGGWAAVESVDPRTYWTDPKGRNLYRRRRLEVDKHQLMRMAKQTDGNGEPIYDMDAINQLRTQVDEEAQERGRRTTGHETERKSGEPIVLDEYLATIVSPEGNVIGENVLAVVANDTHLIRGPEDNPFWHERDWIVFTPMISVPFSAYGRSYAEDWSDPADAFVEMTNLILDGTFTSSMNAFASKPEWLEDPSQLDEGVYPNVNFKLDEGVGDIRDFMRSIELGKLPQEAVTVWQALKQEMREGAKLSEIALGQVPPKGDITATEASLVDKSSSATVRSMAHTIETRFLEPVLTLIFQTGLQHVDFTDNTVRQELGSETADMLNARKQEFRDRNIHFRVRGISSLVDRQQKLRSLLSFLQTIGSNEILLRAFLQQHDLLALVDELLKLFGVDTLKLQPSERERAIRQIVQQFEGQAEQQGSSPRIPGEQSQQSGG